MRLSCALTPPSESVGSCGPSAWSECAAWLQVGKQLTFSREVQQRVVGVAYPQVGPFRWIDEESGLYKDLSLI